MIAAAIPALDPGLTGVAAIFSATVSAAVGFFAYRNKRRAETNRERVDGATTAIEGLNVLAEQHAKEIARLDAALADCELTKVNQKERIDMMAGQIITLTALTTGAAQDAVKRAADVAARAVEVAAANAKIAVDKAAAEVKTEGGGQRSVHIEAQVAEVHAEKLVPPPEGT